MEDEARSIQLVEEAWLEELEEGSSPRLPDLHIE